VFTHLFYWNWITQEADVQIVPPLGHNWRTPEQLEEYYAQKQRIKKLEHSHKNHLLRIKCTVVSTPGFPPIKPYDYDQIVIIRGNGIQIPTELIKELIKDD